MRTLANRLRRLKRGLFPSTRTTESSIFFGLFLLICFLNLSSLVIFSYPVRTTLRFNLRISLTLWLLTIMLYFRKYKIRSTVLPINSPWYLVPFLRVVEAVSILVRPVTLAFRLLANMRAGHILLTLITKISVGWVLGSIFMLLEFIVCMVQAFVLVILIGVYLEERFSHWLFESLVCKTRTIESDNFCIIFVTQNSTRPAYSCF